MLENIKIILVEPAGALNVGSIARIMKNMGLKQLVLVNPHCEHLSAEARQMAVHAVDVLEKVQIGENLPQALKGCQRAIATTGRVRNFPLNLESPKEALPWLLTPNLNTALIFGPEDRGLSNEELNYAQRFISIPANPEYPSLNLAQAVAICAYELSQLNLQNPEHSEEIKSDIASLDLLEGYYQQLETLLLKIGYLYPHTSKARMEKLRRIYHQAQLSPEEVAMLRGILRQVNWALEQNKSNE